MPSRIRRHNCDITWIHIYIYTQNKDHIEATHCFPSIYVHNTEKNTMYKTLTDFNHHESRKITNIPNFLLPEIRYITPIFAITACHTTALIFLQRAVVPWDDSLFNLIGPSLQSDFFSSQCFRQSGDIDVDLEGIQTFWHSDEYIYQLEWIVIDRNNGFLYIRYAYQWLSARLQ